LHRPFLFADPGVREVRVPPTYLQADRPMTVTTPLGPDVLLLLGFSGHEAISQPFRYELDLAAEDQTQVDFDKLLGHKITVALTVPGGRKRYFSGICISLSQGMRGTEHTSFQMEIAPHLWLLTRRSRSRIFQNIPVPEILKTVLDIPDVSFDLEGTFLPRPYCVQYRETDFNFASRLMEEEGIYYYFKHRADGHQMVVSNKEAFPELQPAELILQQALGTHVEEERITRWQKTQQMCSEKITLRDYHFQMPRHSLEAVEEIQKEVQVGKVTHKLKVGESDTLELYDWPGEYSHRFDAIDRGGAERPEALQKLLEDNKRTSKIRMQQEAVQSIAIHSAGRYRHLESGRTFSLKEHVVVPYTGSSSHDGKYVVTSIDHKGTISGSYRSGEAQELHYDNTFTCIPAGLPFRPRRTSPNPVITGTQTAVVVGPKGKEVFVDKFGRVKVQFHWDRQGKRDADSSCWVRVSQIWAGKGWGGFFWPRIGNEVVVAFEEGDPDRPMIVGSVYNAQNMPPFGLPGDMLVNGIKSCTEHGDPRSNFNALIFFDKPGNEHTQIHSENHQVFTNETSMHKFVGEAHTKIVGGIPFLGSGSGGQGASGTTPEGDTVQDGRITKIADEHGEDAPPGSFNLHDNFKSKDSFGRDLNLTYGEAFEGMLGLKFEEVVLGKTEFYWDLISTGLGEAGKLSPGPLTALAAGFESWLGKSEFKVCCDASFLYGPKFDIQRGPAYVWQDDLGKSVLVTGLATAFTLCPLALCLIYEAVKSKDWSLKERNGWWFTLNAAWNIMQIALAGYERNNAVASICESVHDEHEALATQLGKLIDPTRFMTAALINALNKIAIVTPQTAAMLANGVKPTEANPTWKAWGFPDIQMVNGVFMRRGHDIELVSSWDEVKNKEPVGFGICIDAQGGGPDKKDGNLMLNATGSMTMTAGTAGMSIDSAPGNIVVECDTGGTLYLRNPALPSAPTIWIDKDGIILNISPPPPLPPPPPIQVSVTKDGIVLQCGPSSYIKLKPDAIELNAPKIELGHDIQHQLQAIVLDKTAVGQLTMNGSLVTIGPPAPKPKKPPPMPKTYKPPKKGK
jgi:type VI secretion system secreted protein VgrG